MIPQTVAEVVVVRWLTTGSKTVELDGLCEIRHGRVPRRQSLQPRLQSAAGRCEALLLHGQGERWKSVDGELMGLEAISDPPYQRR